MTRAALGLKGEQAAERYLFQNGYRILDRRWNCRFGELDLVAQEGDEVVFVEVKTRRSTGYGGAAGAIDWHKARRLRHAAYIYLRARRLQGRPFRIDVIAVTQTGPEQARLEHFKSAIGEAD
jgi:putative endonuclease